MISFFKNKLKALTYSDVMSKIIIAVVALSFFITSFSPYSYNTADFFNSISFGGYFFAALLIFTLLCLTVDSRFNGTILVFFATALFFETNSQEKNMYFALAASAALAGIVFYYSKSIRLPSLGKKTTIALCIACGAFLAVFVGGITIIKFLNHRTPNFDFGIFSQMYHYMSETLVPYTTCERDMLLSHFAVHFSPILYVGLPFYMIFPHPSTVLAIQAVAVALGALPLYLLCKHFGLSNNKTIAVVAMYVLHPTVIANNFYYFHENCFLTVLLLFTFYFSEKNKPIPTYIFALLTMMVKEDAPVYILFFGLFLLFSNKAKRRGGLLCLMAVVYFAVVTKLMAVYGQGIMTYRYENFIFEEGGSIYTVVLNVIKNPAYVFSQLLKIEKLEFLVLMLAPMALLPLAIKKPSRIVLLLPMVLINLMTEYKYQYDIGFQYTYATVAFLFYLTVINLSELDVGYAKKLLTTAVCASLVFFSAVNLHRTDAIRTYQNEQYYVETINEALATIPMDKSVKSTSFLIPAMWNRKEVYQYEYSDKETDYVVFDLRWSEDEFKEFREKNMDKYSLKTYEKNVIGIFVAN